MSEPPSSTSSSTSTDFVRKFFLCEEIVHVHSVGSKRFHQPIRLALPSCHCRNAATDRLEQPSSCVDGRFPGNERPSECSSRCDDDHLMENETHLMDEDHSSSLSWNEVGGKNAVDLNFVAVAASLIHSSINKLYDRFAKFLQSGRGSGFSLYSHEYLVRLAYRLSLRMVFLTKLKLSNNDMRHSVSISLVKKAGGVNSICTKLAFLLNSAAILHAEQEVVSVKEMTQPIIWLVWVVATKILCYGSASIDSLVLLSNSVPFMSSLVNVATIQDSSLTFEVPHCSYSLSVQKRPKLSGGRSSSVGGGGGSGSTTSIAYKSLFTRSSLAECMLVSAIRHFGIGCFSNELLAWAKETSGGGSGTPIRTYSEDPVVDMFAKIINLTLTTEHPTSSPPIVGMEEIQLLEVSVFRLEVLSAVSLVVLVSNEMSDKLRSPPDLVPLQILKVIAAVSSLDLRIWNILGAWGDTCATFKPSSSSSCSSGTVAVNSQSSISHFVTLILYCMLWAVDSFASCSSIDELLDNHHFELNNFFVIINSLKTLSPETFLQKTSPAYQMSFDILRILFLKRAGGVAPPPLTTTSSTNNDAGSMTAGPRRFKHYAVLTSCAYCGDTRIGSRNLKICGGCRLSRYCGKSCQQKHWKQVHADVC